MRTAPLVLLIVATFSAALYAGDVVVQLPDGVAAKSAEAVAPSHKPGEEGPAVEGEAKGQAATFTRLDPATPYDLKITLKGGTVLHGVNLGWYNEEPAKPHPEPISDDDREQIRALVSDVTSFYNISRIVTLAGDHDRAAVLVERIRSTGFHSDSGGEVIWRVELVFQEPPRRVERADPDEQGAAPHPVQNPRRVPGDGGAVAVGARAGRDRGGQGSGDEDHSPAGRGNPPARRRQRRAGRRGGAGGGRHATIAPRRDAGAYAGGPGRLAAGTFRRSPSSSLKNCSGRRDSCTASTRHDRASDPATSPGRRVGGSSTTGQSRRSTPAASSDDKSRPATPGRLPGSTDSTTSQNACVATDAGSDAVTSTHPASGEPPRCHAPPRSIRPGTGNSSTRPRSSRRQTHRWPITRYPARAASDSSGSTLYGERTSAAPPVPLDRDRRHHV